MKKITLTIILLTTGLFHQSTIAQDVYTGFKFGLNFANLKEDGSSTKGKVGFHGGVFIEAALNEKFSIQPELLYSSQGAKEEVPKNMGYNFSGESTLKLDYINIPIMFKYYPIENLSITAGPQIGFLVKSKFTIDSPSYQPQAIIDNSKVNDLFNKLDYGVNFGLELNTAGFFFGARYNLGLANIYKNSGLFTLENKAYNRVFQLSTGYKF
ncbi:porin family protein [Flavobacterium sp. HSC-61S13]|uniref:porin family protein n=1 Tax=Flavobacterium sp. HSC-61S13 TaxID=2910963 RepID=UPI0020A1ECB9|nr:porin family protein [Flavobacterium sp. HSC-61S13]MCP1995632.1 hypothetical protein [Flavobacterium sp. HSC-61S13]